MLIDLSQWWVTGPEGRVQRRDDVGEAAWVGNSAEWSENLLFAGAVLFVSFGIWMVPVYALFLAWGVPWAHTRAVCRARWDAQGLTVEDRKGSTQWAWSEIDELGCTDLGQLRLVSGDQVALVPAPRNPEARTALLERWRCRLTGDVFSSGADRLTWSSDVHSQTLSLRIRWGRPDLRVRGPAMRWVYLHIAFCAVLVGLLQDAAWGSAGMATLCALSIPLHAVWRGYRLRPRGRVRLDRAGITVETGESWSSTWDAIEAVDYDDLTLTLRVDGARSSWDLSGESAGLVRGLGEELRARHRRRAEAVSDPASRLAMASLLQARDR